jgi:hypothetical protein
MVVGDRFLVACSVCNLLFVFAEMEVLTSVGCTSGFCSQMLFVLFCLYVNPCIHFSKYSLYLFLMILAFFKKICLCLIHYNEVTKKLLLCRLVLLSK